MLITHCQDAREACLTVEREVRKFMAAPEFNAPPVDSACPPNPGEAKANIMLAVRHLEDARMRLGKVIQAMDGGASCYPR